MLEPNGSRVPASQASAGGDREPPRTKKLTRRVRWLVPVGAVAAVGLAIGAAAGAGAPVQPLRRYRPAARPSSSRRSTARAALPPPMTAHRPEIANLGLPSLPGSASPVVRDVAAVRHAHGQDLVRRTRPTSGSRCRCRSARPTCGGYGRDVWLWNSKTSQATHSCCPPAPATEPPGAARCSPGCPDPAAAGQADPGRDRQTTTVGCSRTSPWPASPPTSSRWRPRTAGR